MSRDTVWEGGNFVLPGILFALFVNLDTRRKQHFTTLSQFLKVEITARIQNVNVYEKVATVENTAKGGVRTVSGIHWDKGENNLCDRIHFGRHATVMNGD